MANTSLPKSSACLAVIKEPERAAASTTKQALDLGKEVFAIPGSIHTTVSKGCHDLIKQGAKLVDCAQDILEELKDLPVVDWHTTSTPDLLNPPSALEPFLEKDQIGSSTLRVLDYLGQDPVGLDELQIRSGLSTSQLQAELFQLELNGALGRLQGGLYQKLSPRR